MRIALLTDGIYPHVLGGMQKHSYYLAKYFARNGVFVDVYHAIPYGQEFSIQESNYSTEELKNIRFFPIPFPRNHYFPGHYVWESYLYSKNVFLQFTKQEEVDFIYIQGFSGWKYLENRLSEYSGIRKPLVGINFHGLGMFQKAPSLKVKFEHLLLRQPVKRNLKLADYIFSLGGKLTTIQQIIATNQKILEIPIGITKDWLVDEVHLQNNLIRKFVFIGRYERSKGIEELNIILNELLKGLRLKFEFHFIGPIPIGKQVSKDKRIIYHGVLTEELQIKKILGEADILVCPSWSEGMPTVILEAMATGCAIIATDVGAVSEQVNELNGILISPGNVIELKEAIEKMLSMDEDALIGMKVNSIQKVKSSFLWDKIIERTIEAIKNIVN
jgi:glycosyltransferase involved in cell wall biosynthesis